MPHKPLLRPERWKGRMISHNNITKSGANWAREFGLRASTFYYRFNSGWSMTRIKDTPVFPLPGHISKRLHWSDCVPRKVNCRHPVIAVLYQEMKTQRCTYNMLAKRSGVSPSAILQMRYNGPGYFANVEACVNTLGMKLVVVRERNYPEG